MKNKILSAIVAIALILFGVILLSAPTTDTSAEPKDLAQISYRDVENAQIYYAKDLLVVDQFAVLNEDDVIYMMVMFEDKNGNIVAANMPINKTTPIWDDVNDYLNDSTQLIGDYTINCYVKADTDHDVEGKLNGMFDEAVQEMRGQMGTSINKLGLRFVYVCDENGDPYATAAGAETVSKVVAAVVILGGVLLFVFGVLRKGKKTAAQ